MERIKTFGQFISENLIHTVSEVDLDSNQKNEPEIPIKQLPPIPKSKVKKEESDENDDSVKNKN